LIYFLVERVGGEISKDNLDEDEKKYIDLPEWVELEKIDRLKFHNSINSVEVIKKAAKAKMIKS